jgi:hypothetical protein
MQSHLPRNAGPKARFFCCRWIKKKRDAIKAHRKQRGFGLEHNFDDYAKADLDYSYYFIVTGQQLFIADKKN